MPLFPNISLAILSGGKAKRMGGINKALLKYHDEFFISRIIRNLSPQFGETIIISNSPDDFSFLDLKVYSDVFKDKGPLGGIHSAMVNSKGKAIFTVSCDMPFVCPSVASRIASLFTIKNVDAVIPRIDDKIEPLFAVYGKRQLETLERLLSEPNDHSIRDYLDNINCHFYSLQITDEVKKCFTNINSLSDLDQINFEDRS